jgi:hypothetical protein
MPAGTVNVPDDVNTCICGACMARIAARTCARLALSGLMPAATTIP